MRPSIALVSIFLILFIAAAQAQQQGQTGAPAGTQSNESEISTKDSDTAIKVEVNLVLVPVVVKDSAGNAVSGLKKEDFQLFDNGKLQSVSTFSVETAETRANSGAATAEAKPAETETEKATAGAPAPDVGKTLELPRRFVALVFDDSHMKVAEAMAVHAATLRKTLASIVAHSSKDEGHYECPNISYHQAELIEYQHDDEAIKVANADAIVNECPVNLEATVRRILQEGDDHTSDTYRSLGDIIRKLASMPGQRVLVYVSPGFLVGIP